MLKKIFFVTVFSIPVVAAAQTLRYDSTPNQNYRPHSRLEQQSRDLQQRQGMYQGRQHYIPRSDQYAPYTQDQSWMLNDMEVRRVLVSMINTFLTNRGRNLNIMVRDGVVLVQGQVQSARELDRINRLVHTLENLRFDVQITTRDERQAAGPYNSQDYLIAQNTDATTSVSDSDLKKQVEDKLKNTWFGFGPGYENVTIDVNDGVVTISGIVDDEGDIENVEQKILEVRGVQLVKNNLSAKSADKPHAQDVTDDQIKKSIQKELQDSWWGNYKNVQVEVENGVVILEGSVESASDVKDIQKRLSEIPGVKSIRSDLTLKKKSGW